MANRITEAIPNSPKSPLDYLSNRIPNSLFLIPVTHLEAEDLINTLDPSESVGPNSIPIKLLEILGSCVSPHLASLAHDSFNLVLFLII